jgi:hypothetical protein
MNRAILILFFVVIGLTAYVFTNYSQSLYSLM